MESYPKKKKKKSNIFIIKFSYNLAGFFFLQ